jgi:hypothetical protein
MVDAKTGAPLVAQVRALAERHGIVPRGRSAVPEFRTKAAAGQQPLERWWTPAEASAPKPEPVLTAHLADQQKVQEQSPAQAAARAPSSLDLLGGTRSPAPPSAPAPQPQPAAGRPPLLPSSLWLPLLAVAGAGAFLRAPLAGIALAALLAGAIALYRWWSLPR